MLCEKQSQVHQTDDERKESQGIHLLGLIYIAYNGIKNSSSLFFLTWFLIAGQYHISWLGANVQIPVLVHWG
jgi:hypothetical protein